MLFRCHKLTTFCLLLFVIFVGVSGSCLSLSVLSQFRGFEKIISWGFLVERLLLLPLLNFYYLNPHFGVSQQKKKSFMLIFSPVGVAVGGEREIFRKQRREKGFRSAYL